MPPFFLLNTGAFPSFIFSKDTIKRSVSFKKRLIFSFFLVAILVVTAQFALLYRTGNRVLLEEIRKRLNNVVCAASQFVPHDAHEALSSPTQESSDTYKRAVAPLEAILKNTPRVRYIYTIKRVNGRYFFILDASPPGDHDHDGVDDKAHVMQEYTEINIETKDIIDAALDTGKAITQTNLLTDRWGTFLSSFAPLRAPDGTIYAVVGVDMEVDELKKNLSHFRDPALMSLLIGLFLALLLSTALASYFKKMLGHFKKAITHLADDKEERDRSQELNIASQSNDEFGEIIRTVDDMQALIMKQKQTLREQIRQLKLQSEDMRDAHRQTESALTALKATQVSLVQTQKLAALGQLGASLAHELNTPIAAALETSRQILEETSPTHPDYALFSQLKLACEHMAKVVKSISIFSRQQSLERAPISIQHAIDNALVLVGHRLKKEGIAVRLQAASPHAIVFGNLPQLQELFINLFVNACDAMDGKNGDREKFIDISTHILEQENMSTLRIQISDNGHGISSTIESEIFNPFFTTKPSEKGTGLGLSICYGIVKSHGGDIHISTAHNAGACFEITLPLYHQAREGSVP